MVARITWDVPADNNAEITGYTLRLYQDPHVESEVVMTSETAVNVYLAPAQTYTVTVTATNVVGSRTSHMTTVRGIMTSGLPLPQCVCLCVCICMRVCVRGVCA